MSAFGIVEALDVVEHVGSGLVSGSVHFARSPFGLQRGEEALHRRIVPDVDLPRPRRAACLSARGLRRCDGNSAARHRPLVLGLLLQCPSHHLAIVSSEVVVRHLF